MALPAQAERVIREVIQVLGASRITFRSHQIERAREQLEALLVTHQTGGASMRSLENLHENLAMAVRTLEALHADARALAEAAPKRAPLSALARAIGQAHTVLAAAIQAAEPKKKESE